jgi:hypothetical protein
MAPGPDMPKRRSSSPDGKYGLQRTYKGYDIVRMDGGFRGDVFRVYDGLMPLSPDFGTMTETKMYIDENL